MSLAVAEKFYNAAAFDRVSEVLSLLQKHPEINVNRFGFDVNWRDPIHWTPLHIASISGHVEVVKVLLAHSAISVNLQNRNGRTAFSKASEWGQVPIVRLLLKDPRVDVTLGDDGGRTPLWRALHEERRKAIEWLIASGRDLGDVNGQKGTHWDGKEYSALELARELVKNEVLAVLERFVANPTQTRQEIRKKLNFKGLLLFPFSFSL